MVMNGYQYYDLLGTYVSFTKWNSRKNNNEKDTAHSAIYDHFFHNASSLKLMRCKQARFTLTISDIGLEHETETRLG